MSQYEGMSYVYDRLTQDQPYDKWFEIVSNMSEGQANILDIGCGTGSLTTKLQNLGQVTGMDLSVDMLAVAAQKCPHIVWLEGDMTDFELQQQFDIITIFCDSLNYLSTLDEVKLTFENVYKHLSENGVFLFDVHTVHKMTTLFNNQNYIDDNEDIFLAWQAIEGEEPYSVYHDMTFFHKQADQTYTRFDESHYQRTFDEQTYIKLLIDCGFKNIETFTDFNEDEHNDNADRLFFKVSK